MVVIVKLNHDYYNIWQYTTFLKKAVKVSGFLAALMRACFVDFDFATELP
jgi:hypothetical protein